MQATPAAGDVPESTPTIDTDRLADAVLTHRSDVPWVLVEDEVVAHHTASATSHVLNPSAGLLWRCVDGQSTLHDILVDIADIYQVEVGQLTEQVVPVVAEWVESELLESDLPCAAKAGEQEQPPIPATGPAANEEWERLPDPPNQ